MNESLRWDYDLDKDSVVFDLGGYKGQWTADIFSRFGSNMYVFEPVKEFSEQIRQRFKDNRKIRVFRSGLSNRSYAELMYVDRDSSSVYKKGDLSQYVQMVEVAYLLKEEGINHIDLMKINIEGAEYDLLDHLIETGIVGHIDNIQVQFHDIIPDAEKRMVKIQEQLSKTHRVTYQYKFVWENWERCQ